MPVKVTSITIASPAIASKASCSMPGLSRKKWCGVSMCVAPCTVISTMFDTTPFSSHFTIGLSLKMTREAPDARRALDVSAPGSYIWPAA